MSPVDAYRLSQPANIKNKMFFLLLRIWVKFEESKVKEKCLIQSQIMKGKLI